MLDPLEFAREVHRRVPAYRSRVPEVGAWGSLPLLTKRDYLLAHPTVDLCWDGSLAGCHLVGASSGFSKKGSIFWPKRPADEGAYVAAIETMLVQHYAIDRKPTLILVCLAFGTWIGGMQIAAACRSLASAARHPVTVATPGLNLKEAVEIYAEFGAGFEQVLVITNPSNIQLVAALLERRGLEPPPGSFSFPVVGEYFSETFREWVATRFGHPADSPFCVWTGYGSADTGDLGVETAATVALRKQLLRDPARCRELFGVDQPPMLLVPSDHAFLEIVDGNLVVTKDQMIPLVRYDTGDAAGLWDSPAGRVLYVHGRASDAVIFYGTNLALPDVDDCLLARSEALGYGGSFQLRQLTREGFPVFHFTVAVRGEPSPERAAAFSETIVSFLKGRSAEFAAKYEALSEAAGEPLIQVSLEPASEQGRLKHHYLVED